MDCLHFIQVKCSTHQFSIDIRCQASQVLFCILARDLANLNSIRRLVNIVSQVIVYQNHTIHVFVELQLLIMTNKYEVTEGKKKMF